MQTACHATLAGWLYDVPGAANVVQAATMSLRGMGFALD
jgi:hypothetical protein